MMGFFEATRWAVAQTVTEVFVISMSIARELSVLDPRTKALALKAVTARMHWEAVCEASYAQEHVSITPAMMTYANYQINPEGVTQVANKKKSDTKSRRAEARADLEDVVASTITLLAEAEVYEQQGEYLRAEEIIGKCHEICTKMLKRANELVKNGDMDRAARAQIATELKARANLCEERMSKLAQERVRTHMAEGRLRRREAQGTIVHKLDGPAEPGGDSPGRRRHHRHHHGDDPASSSPEPSPDKGRLTVNSHCARLDALATKNVSRGGGAGAKRRVTKFVNLNEALLDSDHGKAETKKMIDKWSKRSERRRLAEEARESDAPGSPADDPSDERGDRNQVHRVLNHLEVTPASEHGDFAGRRRRRPKEPDVVVGEGLARSMDIIKKESLLSLDQERTLGSFGLPTIDPHVHRPKTSTLLLAREGRRRARAAGLQHRASKPLGDLPAGDRPKSSSSSTGLSLADDGARRSAPSTPAAPPAPPSPTLDEGDDLSGAPSPKGFKPPTLCIRKMIQLHQVAERRLLATSQRRFELYEKALAATSPTQ